jgi:hypothetical protein
MPRRLLRDWTDSAKVAAVSAEAERLFVRLIMRVDDHGRHEGNPRLLKSLLFPLHDKITDTMIVKWLSELTANGLVTAYEVSGKAYVQIEQFGQRTRYPSRYPDPCPENTVSLSQTKSGEAGQSPPVHNIHINAPINAPLIQSTTDDSRNQRPPKHEPPIDGNEFASRRRVSRTSVPPPIEDMVEYGAEIGVDEVMARKCHNYWASAGWRRKSGPVKDWEATLRTWRDNNIDTGKSGVKVPVSDPIMDAWFAQKD